MNGQFEVYLNFESKLIRILRGVAPGMLWSTVDGIVKKYRKKAGVQTPAPCKAASQTSAKEEVGETR